MVLQMAFCILSCSKGWNKEFSIGCDLKPQCMMPQNAAHWTCKYTMCSTHAHKLHSKLVWTHRFTESLHFGLPWKPCPSEITYKYPVVWHEETLICIHLGWIILLRFFSFFRSISVESISVDSNLNQGPCSPLPYLGETLFLHHLLSLSSFSRISYNILNFFWPHISPRCVMVWSYCKVDIELVLCSAPCTYTQRRGSECVWA